MNIFKYLKNDFGIRKHTLYTCITHTHTQKFPTQPRLLPEDI